MQSIPALPDRPSRADEIAERIRTAILAGHLNAGEPLVERKLAVQLGVSKTPVREALIALEARGLATTSPNGITTVAVVGPAQLRAIYEVRLQLEPWAMGRAAIRMTPQALEEAAELLAAAGRESDPPFFPDRATVNRRFHRLIYSYCGNDLARSILDRVQDRIALGVASFLWTHWPTWSIEHEEHCQLLESLRSSDSQVVENIVRRHIQRSIDNLDSEPIGRSAHGSPEVDSR